MSKKRATRLTCLGEPLAAVWPMADSAGERSTLLAQDVIKSDPVPPLFINSDPKITAKSNWGSQTTAALTGLFHKSLFMRNTFVLDMCASKIDKKILDEAQAIARMKGFSDVNEFLSRVLKDSVKTKWRGGFFGKRKRLGKARVVSDAP